MKRWSVLLCSLVLFACDSVDVQPKGTLKGHFEATVEGPGTDAFSGMVEAQDLAPLSQEVNGFVSPFPNDRENIEDDIDGFFISLFRFGDTHLTDWISLSFIGDDPLQEHTYETQEPSPSRSFENTFDIRYTRRDSTTLQTFASHLPLTSLNERLYKGRVTLENVSRDRIKGSFKATFGYQQITPLSILAPDADTTGLDWDQFFEAEALPVPLVIRGTFEAERVD